METFDKEITFLEKTFDPEKIKEGKEWELQPTTKTVKFIELSRTDPDQREISWLVMDVFKSEGKNTKIDWKTIRELTDLYIEKMLIIDDNFTPTNKTEFLNDNGAVISFGLWLAHEKILPFFFKLMS
jgi:hypothetical protein